MTGEALLKKLEELRASDPEALKLDVVHVHTEYADSDDSVGCDVEQDVDSVGCVERSWGHGHPSRKVLVVW